MVQQRRLAGVAAGARHVRRGGEVTKELLTCPDCGVEPGKLHGGSCDTESCVLCGGQLISCNCVYELSGIDVERLEEEHPDIFEDGPTMEMDARYMEEVAKYGGRLPWTGRPDGEEDGKRLGIYYRWEDKKGRPRDFDHGACRWASCKKDDEGATPGGGDLHKFARWGRRRRTRRWEEK